MHGAVILQKIDILVALAGGSLTKKTAKHLTEKNFDWVLIIFIVAIFIILLAIIMNLDYFFPTPNPQMIARSITGN